MRYLLFLTGLIFLIACQSAEEPASSEVEMTVPDNTQSEVITATVRYINIEGGFYGLETKDGQKLLPRGLPENMRADGTIIRFKYEPVKDMMTIQQWGTLVQLSDVELVKKAVNKSDL